MQVIQSCGGAVITQKDKPLAFYRYVSGCNIELTPDIFGMLLPKFKKMTRNE
jgi:hypothetical protein